MVAMSSGFGEDTMKRRWWTYVVVVFVSAAIMSTACGGGGIGVADLPPDDGPDDTGGGDGGGHGGSSDFEFGAVEDMTNWNKVFDNANQKDNLNDITTDSLGNVYVIGSSTNLVNATSGKDLWLKKFSENGTEDASWEMKIDHASGKDAGRDVRVDSEGNIYVAGISHNLVAGGSGKDIWIKKFKPDGTEITAGWDKQIDHNNSTDNISEISIDANDNVYLVLKGENIVSATSGEDWWIQKYDKNGIEDSSWAGADADTVAPIVSGKVFDSGGTDALRGLFFDSQGNIYMGGKGENLVTGSSQNDVWIKKFDSSGVEDTSFEVKYDVNEENNEIWGMGINSKDEIFLVGFTRDATDTMIWITKYDTNGVEDTTNWGIQQTCPGHYCKAMNLDFDSKDRIYVSGWAYNALGNNTYNGFVFTYDDQGNQDTEYMTDYYAHDDCGGDLAEFQAKVHVDHNDNVYTFQLGYNLVSGTSGWDWWIKKYIATYTPIN